MNDDDDSHKKGDGVPEFIEGRAESEALIVNPLLGKLLLDRFLVEKKIGEGGFGSVYRGKDTVTGRLVAIKFLLHTIGKKARQALARFQREAAITGRLNHPFIITIYDSGIHDGCPFIVMEWVHGETLTDRLNRGPIDWHTLVKILRDVASALAHAADQGVVHRDMKPDNIMIREPSGTAVVLDFGIAASYELDEEGFSVTRKDRVTTLGLIMGTPDYISPESWAGVKALDGRADVYALGAMIYRALQGRSMWGIVPASGNDIPAFALLAEHAKLKPRPPITTPVPDGVRVLYEIATIADREDRPWPEGFLKACEELLASDGLTITLDARSRTVSARLLGGDSSSASSIDAASTSTKAFAPSEPPPQAVPVRTPTPAEVALRRPGLVVGGLIGVVVLSASIAGAIFWALSKSTGTVATATATSSADSGARASGAPEQRQVAPATNTTLPAENDYKPQGREILPAPPAGAAPAPAQKAAPKRRKKASEGFQW